MVTIQRFFATPSWWVLNPNDEPMIISKEHIQGVAITINYNCSITKLIKVKCKSNVWMLPNWKWACNIIMLATVILCLFEYVSGIWY